MMEYKKRKETKFLSEGWKRPAKILALSVLLTLYLFFFIWALVSPFLSSDTKISPDTLRFSVAIFFSFALIFVTLIYSGYRVGPCPYCDKKLFFAKGREGIRCFRCGRYIKIDWQNKLLVDEEIEKKIE
ncbi:hypothetical protein HRbin19_01026 [bacterium HR19]|nr:hypothetical protein HRbin19_01026 [bacterium HR19]